jgi:hypothetical protein
MDNDQTPEEQVSVSKQSSLFSSKAVKMALFIISAVAILGIAAVWALNDISWIPGPWANIAVIFFTGVVLVSALVQGIL